MVNVIERKLTVPISDKAKLGAAIDEQLTAMGLKRWPEPNHDRLRELLLADGIDPSSNECSSAIIAERDRLA